MSTPPLSLRAGLALLFAAGCVVESSRPPVVSGDGIVANADGSKVSVDPSRVPMMPSCAAGQVPRRTETGWDCVAPTSLAPDAIPVVPGCTAGQLVTKTADGWACVDAPYPTRTPIVNNCPVGMFVQRTADGWTCAPSVSPEQTPVVDGCRPGDVPTRTATGWSCAPAVDALRTPILADCQQGEYVFRSASGWECLPAIDTARTPIVSVCNAGQVVRRTATGWDCMDAPGVDATKTPVVPTCGPGLYVRRAANGTAWECTTLSGLLTGSLVGPVTGNVTGNVIGNLTGGVTGNVAGNVTGNLRGDVTGNVTGNLRGDVTGNTTGRHVGPVQGDLVGNVSGSLTGNSAGVHTGNVVGNVTGDVTGRLIGNVTGTATNVTGVVAVANGGTGTAAFTPGALVVGGNGLLEEIVPGGSGSLLTTQNGRWAATKPSDLPIARRTTGVRTVYVRSDGSDTACDGSADVADSAAARPACAYATPQSALDALPDVLLHSATVSIAPGTYRTAAGGTAVDVAKIARASAYLTIRGSGDPGTVILSGATAAQPTTAAAARGLYTSLPIDTLIVQNLTFDRFAEAGLRIPHSAVTFDAITVQNCGNGVICERGALCTVTSTLLTGGSASRGLIVMGGSRFTNAGLVTTSTTDANGIYIEGSVASDAGSAVWLINSAANTATSSGFGLILAHGSIATFSGNLTIKPGGTQGFITTDRSAVVVAGTTTINTVKDNAVAFQTNNHSFATLTGTLVIDQNSNPGTIGLGTSNYSVTSIAATAPTITVARSANPLWTVTYSTFYDGATASSPVSRTAASALVTNLSLYLRGGKGFPVASACAIGSQCP